MQICNTRQHFFSIDLQYTDVTDWNTHESLFQHSASWIIEHLLEIGLVDKIDAIILHQLLNDSRQSTQAIANIARVSRGTAHERIKRLKEKGIIDRFTTKLNYNNCGLPLRAFILVSYDAAIAGTEYRQATVAKLISRIKYVTRVNIITGNHDFLVEIAIPHMNMLSDLIIEEMRNIPGVGNTITMISFDEYRDGFRQERPKKPH
ncbi:MAG: Lrp/AsnC family transcriptional regulator [Methanobacteriota archaeon]|nr:MAG: Lrp/AsnC family transcriptional regulator [Euryarchaeota archaeon]